MTAAVRAVIQADMLSDSLELALNTATFFGLLAVITLLFFSARTTQAPLPRASVLLMALVVACLIAAFIRLTYADVSIELADLVQPVDAAESTTQIVVGPTGGDIRLSGDIKEGAADLLEALLKANPSIDRIHLTSEGGFAEEGQALADIIAAHHLTTYVPDYCLSACTLAFVGGHERILMEGAQLGFHAPYQQGLLGQTFVGDAKKQRDAYLKAGLSADFVDKALKIAPDDIWMPRREQLLEARVATTYVNRYHFPDSLLDGAADNKGARDTVLRNFPLLKSIDAEAPQAIDRIAGWYLEAYRRGSSEGESADGLEKIISATLTLVLNRADDATLLDLAHFVQAALNIKASSEECEMIGRDIDLVRAVAVLEDSDKTAEAIAERLVRRALNTGRRISLASQTSMSVVAPDETCGAIQKDYANVLQHRDPTSLHHRLQAAASNAARLLAPLARKKP